MQYESEHIEYKSQFVEDIYKEVIAFANTNGGVIYIGVDDNGNLVRIDNVDETYTRLTNGIRDTIAPDVTMFIKYTLQDNKIIQIEVNEGSYKPYYLKSKGMKPQGVYVRQGASSVQASFDQIRKMIKENDGDIYEEMRSSNQNLTFSEIQKAFNYYNIDFSENKYFSLGIKNIHDNQYTNLATIVSNQCQHSIKIAVFADEDNLIFKDAKEFKGSVFKQLDESYSYLKLCNRTRATIHGLERMEYPDYPEEAIREALLNAIVHRDYSYSGSIIINVNNAFIEFISIGGLLPGLSTRDIQSGISQPRNQHLAEIFHRLKLIESYGTGIRKIFALYKNHSIQPKIEVTDNTFKIILPNMNANTDETIKRTAGKKTPAVLNRQIKNIIEFLNENEEITDEEVQNLLNIKKTRSYLLLRQMMDSDILVTVGKGSKKKYRLK